MPTQTAPVPVSLLTGFLGSGKTTLLNALLRDPAAEPTLVIINEFGDIPIDNLLVDFVDPNTVTTTNGCICCAAPSDLILSLCGFLKDRENGVRHFERIVIETTGLADPIPTLTTLMQNPDLAGRLRLDSVIVTADAVNGVDQIARFVEARRQLAVADRIVLTKQDIATAAQIAATTAALRGCNPAAPIVAAGAGCDALFGASLWNAKAGRFEPSRWMQAEAYASASSHGETTCHSGGIGSASLILPDSIEWDSFYAWVEELRDRHTAHLLRLKGLLFTREHPDPIAVHAIHTVFHPPTPVRGACLGDRCSRVVVIAQGVDPHQLLEDLRRRCEGTESRASAPCCQALS